MFKIFISLFCTMCCLSVMTGQAQPVFFQSPPTQPATSNNKEPLLTPTPALKPTMTPEQYSSKVAEETQKKDAAAQQQLNQKLSDVEKNAPPLPAEPAPAETPPTTAGPPPTSMPPPAPTPASPPPPMTTSAPPIMAPTQQAPVSPPAQITPNPPPPGQSDSYTGFGSGKNTGTPAPTPAPSGGGWNIRY